MVILIILNWNCR